MDKSGMSRNHHSAADAEAHALSMLLPVIHEAGHAVVARKLGRGIKYVTVSPGEKPIHGTHAGGMTCYTRTTLGERVARFERGQNVTIRRSELAREIMIACAGFVAEGIFLEDYGAQKGGLPPGIFPPNLGTEEIRSDIALIHRYRGCLNEKDQENFTFQLFDAAEKILNANWNAVRLLAEELQKRKTLEGKQVYELIDNVKVDD